jgi:hypothetical protein
MILKPIHDIRLADLDALVGVVAEGKTIEYKREMPGGTSAEKVKFLAAVSSLANTAGGDLLIGVPAKDGIPIAISGIAVPSIDNEKLRLEHLLADCIEPRIPRVEIEPIACGTGQHVLVIRVHRSWLAPHRVKLSNRFYGRNSAGKYPLDVSELRSAFVLSESAAEKIRNFRNERLIKITARETSIALHDGPVMVIHVIPFTTFAGVQTIDPVEAARNGKVLPQPIGRGVLGDQPQALVNLDGFATIARPSGGRTHGYVQLFRSGAIEAVTTVGIDDQKKCYLASTQFENSAISAIRNYLEFFSVIDTGLPIFVFLSFCGMTQCYLRVPESYRGIGYYDRGPLPVDTVALSEAMIDSEPADPPAAMRTSFNTIWNAYGYEKSDKYDDNGWWKGVG